MPDAGKGHHTACGGFYSCFWAHGSLISHSFPVPPWPHTQHGTHSAPSSCWPCCLWPPASFSFSATTQVGDATASGDSCWAFALSPPRLLHVEASSSFESRSQIMGLLSKTCQQLSAMTSRESATPAVAAGLQDLCAHPSAPFTHPTLCSPQRCQACSLLALAFPSRRLV